MELKVHYEPKHHVFDQDGQRLLGKDGEARRRQQMWLIIKFMPAAYREYCELLTPPSMVWERVEKRLALHTEKLKARREGEAAARRQEAEIHHAITRPPKRDTVPRAEGKRAATRLSNIDMYY